MTLADRIDRALRELGLRDGDRLGIACSGGADSVALLHLVVRAPIDVEVVALHVDHGLRSNSAADADFVGALSARLGLEAHIRRVDVDRRHAGGPEAAAREVRYAALDSAAQGLGLRWVATAHTLDDQAETVMLRTIRGGSLAAIAPKRGIFVRPLLDVERSALRAWLRDEGISWREDATNDDTRLERNWMRATVMPLLHERRPGVANVLARIAQSARADAEILDAMADDVVARAEVDDAGVLLTAAELDSLPAGLATRVVRRALRIAGFDPRWSDVDAVLGMDHGAHVACGPVSVWRLREGLAIVREPVPVPASVELPPAGVIEAQGWGLHIRVGRADEPAWTWRCPVPGDAGRLMVRRRQPGDRVRTSAGSRKVQDVLVDAKVPRPLRDLVPLVATGDGSLAVVGLTTVPAHEVMVIDARPADPTWSRRAPWTT